jgi:tRNA (guanine26-N2/guanine27-N2)-dimethyltransferase
MWSGPLHDALFTSKVLEHLEANQDKYGTATRMKGMLTVAQEVIKNFTQLLPANVVKGA